MKSAAINEQPVKKKWYGMNWIRPDKRLAIYLRDGFRCVYCGESLRDSDPATATLDHLIPRCEGGDNDETNLVTACRSCNSTRQDKPWREYATGGSIDRILNLIAKPLNRKLAKALIDGTAGDPEVEVR